MIYSIPKNKFDKLEKKIKRYLNKGAQIKFNIVGNSLKDGVLIIPNYDYINHTFNCFRKPIKVECIDVDVDGVYRINDWDFVGTIEHKENGNIIRCANSMYDNIIPTKYNDGCYCEHCKTNRIRKDTYLIYNIKSNEFKQVGKNCLFDYTNGLDVQECAEIMSCFEFVKDANDNDNLTFNMDDFEIINNAYIGIDTKEIKKYAYALVKKDGFTKGKTTDALIEYYFGTCVDWKEKYGKLVLPSDETIKEIDEYVKNIKNQSGYMYNAKIAWECNCCEYRDLGLIASFIGAWFKIKNKFLTKGNSEFVGSIGDKIRIDVNSFKCVYSEKNYHYNKYFYELLDQNGNVYMWSTSNELDKNVKAIVAKIKDQKVFNGVKQNIITLGKVIETYDL